MKSKYTKAFIVVTTLFFMWGFITVLVDSLVPRLREMFDLSYSEALLVQFAFFIAYAVVSIPAGALLSNIGYKKGMLLGLTTMGIGCLLFIPAASMRLFPLFMLGYFILASGITVLQVAANPYVSVLGPEETASSRLILSQAFNSLGTTIAPIIGAIYILSDNIKSSDEINALNESGKLTYFASEASAIKTPFLVLASSLLLLAVLIALFKLPQIIRERSDWSGYATAISNKKLMLGALGIFVYVGAEVSIGTLLVNYFLELNLVENIKSNSLMSSICEFVLGADYAKADNKGIVGAFVAFYWGGAMVGRFIGSALTRVIAPGKVLAFFGLGAITLILISLSSGGFVCMWSILGVGLFNSIMFPTIFTIGISELGDLKPQGSGILCTAIAGGAFIPWTFAKLVDLNGFHVAFILVILCYAYILYYGWSNRNPKYDMAISESNLDDHLVT